MLEALIDTAQTQLAAILARGANLDAQALGLIGFDAVFVATALAAQQPLGHLWWVPVPGLTISIVAGAWVMAVARFDLGPSLMKFYENRADRPRDEGLQELFEELIVSQTHNELLLLLKTGRLIVALAVLLATVTYSTLVFALA